MKTQRTHTTARRADRQGRRLVTNLLELVAMATDVGCTSDEQVVALVRETLSSLSATRGHRPVRLATDARPELKLDEKRRSDAHAA